MKLTFDIFKKTRGFFKTYIEQLSIEELNRIPKGFNNNIIWNIGHIVATEQVLIYKLSGVPMSVSDQFIERYRKGTKPEKDVTEQEVEEIKMLLLETIQKTKIDYSENAFSNFQEYTPETTGTTLYNVDDALEFAVFHEGVHLGIVNSLLKTIRL